MDQNTIFQDSEACMPSYPGIPYHSRISILQEPQDICAIIGDYVNFIAKVHCSGYATFQWYNGSGYPVYNKISSNLFLGPIQHRDFGSYQLKTFDPLTNECILTRWVTLKKREIHPPKYCPLKLHTNPSKPRQITELEGGDYCQGDTVVLCAEFENATSYNWYKDGRKLEFCGENTLVIHSANRNNTGVYEIGAVNDRSGLMVTSEASVYIH